MKSKYPASHLLRQFLLFALTVLFLLTLIRAAYGLWQFPKLSQADRVLPWFVEGLRYDVALVGLICFIPVVVGSLLSMLSKTRALAKFMISAFLLSGLLLVLVMELITPWFLQTQGLRPDVALLGQIEHPAAVLATVFSEQSIPLSVASFLCVLILVTFWGRMEMRRFLKYRLSVPSALSLSIVGGMVCILAIRSSSDMSRPGLSPLDSLISEDAIVNDLTMNTTYKLLYSIVQPSPVTVPLDASGLPVQFDE
ncbi:hypothetical protein [Granulosicoccus antarcticus]|uniref:LTA synthase family protein n=1 Tax=Granulosicoccus antarcticus IMCC3135 TaxID=1192854 RepID=A0A2Z2NME7_9GAMM|nr:hypothetical protein [Granulosicoccus antarcticus]ASJ72536.1 hypothetical protein IMCC3135_12240 [Granulosicoccus antarcticus IMCC3135]